MRKFLYLLSLVKTSANPVSMYNLFHFKQKVHVESRRHVLFTPIQAAH